MHTLKLSIKNMVCDRCIRVVREELENLGLVVENVQLGFAQIQASDNLPIDIIRQTLQQNGFELLTNRKVEYVEQIKIEIIQLIRSDRMEHFSKNLSHYLADKLGKDYHTLSAWFSEVETITIAKFVARQKVERIKEWLEYGELNLSTMARLLDYSSIGHLSNQFRQVTGFSPSYYKKHIIGGAQALGSH